MADLPEDIVALKAAVAAAERRAEAIRAAHPNSQIELWFQDEARVGQKGRTGHR